MKNITIKEETGIMTGKKKFDAYFDLISKKLASIKRHFFASPFEMMLETVRHNHENKDSRTLPNLSFTTKHDGKEKVWIVFESRKIINKKTNSPSTTVFPLKTDPSSNFVKFSCR